METQFLFQVKAFPCVVHTDSQWSRIRPYAMQGLGYRAFVATQATRQRSFVVWSYARYSNVFFIGNSISDCGRPRLATRVILKTKKIIPFFQKKRRSFLPANPPAKGGRQGVPFASPLVRGGKDGISTAKILIMRFLHHPPPMARPTGDSAPAMQATILSLRKHAQPLRHTVLDNQRRKSHQISRSLPDPLKLQHNCTN